MRSPLSLINTKFEDDARVKFIYTSPEHSQNIEISVDGEETSVEVLLDAFKRFVCALGVPIPSNVGLEFVEYNDKNDEETDEPDFGSDEDQLPPPEDDKKKKRK